MAKKCTKSTKVNKRIKFEKPPYCICKLNHAGNRCDKIKGNNDKNYYKTDFPADFLKKKRNNQKN